jgi:hypothetical protein
VIGALRVLSEWQLIAVRQGSMSNTARPATIDGRFLFAILGAGLLLRLLWQVQINGNLTAFAGAGEATRVAMAIAEGRGFADAYFVGSGPTAHLLPVNPGIAGIVMALFGIDTPGSNIMLVAVALMQVGFAYLMLMRLFTRIGADPVTLRWSLLALCLLPVFVQREVIDFRYWEGALAVGLAAASLAMLAGTARADVMTLRDKMLAALLMAFTFFVSPTVGLAVVTCWALFSLRTEQFRASFVSAAIVAGSFAVFLAPWAIRNQIALGETVIVRSNAGLELALANHSGALSDRPTIKTFADRIVAIHPYHGRTARVAMTAAGGEVLYSRQLGAEAKAWIVAHPMDFVRLSLGHIRQLYFPEDWAYRYNESDRFNPQRAVIIALVNAIGLLSLGFGLVTRRRGYAMLATYIGCITLTYAVIQPIPRYTYLVYAPLMFVAVDGLVRAARALAVRATSLAPGRSATGRQAA